jgi:DNA modification methylase
VTSTRAVSPTPTRWRNRIVDIAEVPPDDLVANPANWRSHPKEQRDALAAALDEVGWVAQVVVNRRSGNLIDGHLRVDLALARGEPTVPVVYIDVSEEEERLILATLDPLAAMAQAEASQLKALLDGLDPHDEGLRAMLDELGRAHGLDGLLPRLDIPDDVLPLPEEPYVKPGELWLLDGHRLLVGDATDAKDVSRLLDGAEPGLMVSDPPYGVSYDPTWRTKPGGDARDGTVSNDDRADWREAWALSPATVGYIWHGGLHARTVADSLAAAGYGLRAQIIWAKPSQIMGRGAYHWQHEPCWYVVKEGAKGRWGGDRTQTTLWQIDGVRAGSSTGEDEATAHGTQKPVECMQRPMRNHEPMDVYDPFIGSGTTIIAAERQGRACYAMDVDPVYAQVAIERWQTFTGKTAEKVA